MSTRLASFVENQILLGDICDIGRLLIFGEQMVVGLIFRGTHSFRNGLPPLIGVAHRRIYIKDHATKCKEAMLHDLSDAEFRGAYPVR